MALLLGVDIGTSSTTGALVTPEGELVAEARRAHPVLHARPGWAEHDADAVWWGEFVEVARELRAIAQGRGDDIAAVAASGVGPVALLADENGRALRAAVLYGIDTRAMPEARELTERWRLGRRLGADDVAPKLLWLDRHEHEIAQQARTLLMPQSLVALRLTGRYCLDIPSIPDDFLGWDEIAPQIRRPDAVWPGEAVGTVSAEGAAASGLPEGIPVAAGTRDSFADAVSVGLSQPGDGVVIYGTTMSTVLLTGEGGGPFVHPDVGMLGSGMATSGALTQWFRQVVGEADLADLLADAAASPPGAHGLVALPYFAGERSPLGDPEARGVLVGLTTRTTRGDIARALLEATAFGLRHCLDAGSSPADAALGLQASGLDQMERPYAVGGGVQHPLWPQIVSDVTGLTQQLTAGATGACVGDAFVAGLASGLVTRDDRWVKVTGEVVPDTGVRELYDERYLLYRQLHPATVDIQHALARS